MKTTYIIVSRKAPGAPVEHYAFGVFTEISALPQDGRGTVRHPAEVIDAKVAEFRRNNPRRVDVTALQP